MTAYRQDVPSGKVLSFDAAIASDVPLGSGLSSSAALEVAMATLVEQFTGVEVGGVEKALRSGRCSFLGLHVLVPPREILSLAFRDPPSGEGRVEMPAHPEARERGSWPPRRTPLPKHLKPLPAKRAPSLRRLHYIVGWDRENRKRGVPPSFCRRRPPPLFARAAHVATGAVGFWLRSWP